MTKRRHARALCRTAEHGAAAVEFALIVIPMLYLVFGGISFAYMFSFRQALSQAASEGARAAVGSYNTTDGTCADAGPYAAATCPSQFAASTEVTNALNTYGQTCGTKNLTCTIMVGTAPMILQCASGHTCIKVVVSYPYRDHSLLPTVPGYGFVLPSYLTFTSVVQLT